MSSWIEDNSLTSSWIKDESARKEYVIHSRLPSDRGRTFVSWIEDNCTAGMWVDPGQLETFMSDSLHTVNRKVRDISGAIGEIVMAHATKDYNAAVASAKSLIRHAQVLEGHLETLLKATQPPIAENKTTPEASDSTS